MLLRRQLADSLRRAILEGFFQPGDRLVERGLLELVGGSRTSVREALRQIETEGLVTVTTRGVHVADASADEVEQLQELLATLEKLLIRRVRRNATPAEITRILELGLRCDEALSHQDGRAAATACGELWSLLLMTSGSHPLRSSLLSLEHRLALHRRLAASQERRTDRMRALVSLVANGLGGEPRQGRPASESSGTKADGRA